MAHYDYSGLTDIDFENLVQSILQADLNITLEAFKKGPDSGIDLRYSRDPGGSLIIQCKHYRGSGLQKLLRVLRNDESPKVARLKPARYILATSVSLSPNNKKEIVEIFKPYIKNPQDVYGAEQISGLLERFPQVARQNIKLYLTNWSALSMALNSDMFCSARFVLNEARRKSRLYLESQKHASARKILETENVCLISGPPGVGKTTLAEMLLLEHKKNGWEVFNITDDLKDISRVYNEEEKQIFLYDDFLGQISSTEKLNKNEDRFLTTIIKQISTDANKRLLLTTREYILQDSKSKYEALEKLHLGRKTCTVECSDYLDIDRAKILYNHLYYSELPAEWIRYIGSYSRIEELIFHSNFNPRLIEDIIALLRSENELSPEGCFQFFIDNLDNPKKIWHHAFMNQIPSDARKLLLNLASFNKQADFDDIRKLYFSICGGTSYDNGVNFTRVCRLLEKTFLRIDQTQRGYTIRLSNPSIRDYLVHLLAAEPESLRMVLNEALFLSQVVSLWMLSGDQSNHARQYARPLRKYLMVDCRSEFLGALRRTFYNSETRTVRSWITTDGSSDEPPIPFSLEKRFIKYCEIVDDLNENIDMTWSEQILTDIFEGWDNGKASRILCIDIIKIIRRKRLLPTKNLHEIILRARNFILTSKFTETADFDCLCNFRLEFPDVLAKDDLKAVHEVFSDWLNMEGYEALRYEGSDLLPEVVEWLNSVAETLGFELDANIMKEADERMAAHAASDHVRDLVEVTTIHKKIVVTRITSIEFGETVQSICDSLANDLYRDNALPPISLPK